MQPAAAHSLCSHVCGLRRVFPRHMSPEKTDFSLISPPSGGETLPRAFCLQEYPEILHGFCLFRQTEGLCHLTEPLSCSWSFFRRFPRKGDAMALSGIAAKSHPVILPPWTRRRSSQSLPWSIPCHIGARQDPGPGLPDHRRLSADIPAGGFRAPYPPRDA